MRNSNRQKKKKNQWDLVKDWMEDGEERCQNLNINQVEPAKCFLYPWQWFSTLAAHDNHLGALRNTDA